ncbi:hypothetical protein N7499_002210 [Penicillium canescens]|uniref:Uncharacterized protein n=1 Tax=Penicillium canescens TaxID=5083 RepID=A0AAD6I741_PENCN|nr:uncharacterized protein N7446_009751 [Penicillium canescens]KAJ6034992.1 hypothetical protein N7460_009167 [Penicillium canescens]KAJ6046655.1 hypothetical protein N7444_007909 [Penicillium canescens]KAJ6053739.1 hypothetical protein N7446_009751 [Penicillium canescens]KAJ6097836.1 hypothetical protein N7499_002210 [Penicillium canescens]KAJ6165825.1 hypothetical protein N7485_009069 [Penicillium canescens]
MTPLSFLIAGLNFTRAETVGAGFYRFVADRSLVLSSAEILSEAWSVDSWLTKASEWLSRPDVLAIITAWWITFSIVITIILCLGFGPGGIVTGSLAAAFQSFMYGGFTPASGIFATLTSMAMIGTLMPSAVIFACTLATAVAVIVWKIGCGLP